MSKVKVNKILIDVLICSSEGSNFPEGFFGGSAIISFMCTKICKKNEIKVEVE